MQFLFERLRASPPGADPAARLREAVRDQVQWLVGCREWRAEKEGLGLLDVAMPDLPVPGVNSAQVGRYAERLRHLIECHEPRLRQPVIQLRETGRPLAPFGVVVSGTIDAGDGEEELRFEYEPGPR